MKLRPPLSTEAPKDLVVDDVGLRTLGRALDGRFDRLPELTGRHLRATVVNLDELTPSLQQDAVSQSSPAATSVRRL